MQQPSDVGRRLCFGAMVSPTTARLSHRLYFASRSHPDCALSFPCDRTGMVHLDGLGERDRNNYFFARATVGCDYRRPIVIAVEDVPTH